MKKAFLRSVNYVLALILTVCLLFGAVGCNKANKSETGGGDVSPKSVARLNVATTERFSVSGMQNEDHRAAYERFAYDFFAAASKYVEGGSNACVSPLSAYMAFALCFAGSSGRTADEFEDVFGLDTQSAAEFCQALYAKFLQRDDLDEATKLNVANSVWVDESVEQFVNAAYLDIATNFFNAPVFRCDFASPDTVDAVNGWCSDNTDKFIPKIVDEFDEDQIMALINALLVEAAWETPYEDYSVVDGKFNAANGTQQSAKFLTRNVEVYYDSPDAKAFKMGLRDGFSFVGILPNQDVSFDEYRDGISASKISSLLENPVYDCDVFTRIPKFAVDCSVDLGKTMPHMGLVSAFDPGLADFSEMAEIPGANVYIGTALQKTHFELDENGVKAAAVTYIAVDKATAMPGGEKKIEIYLDRPFIYLLVDDQTNLPLFVGTTEFLK